MIGQLITAVERLSTFPLSGRIVPEDNRWREVISGNYRVVYELEGDQVAIVRVHHARRRMPEEVG